MPLLSGILPTVLTPWDAEDRVDTQALEAQVEHFLAAGVHGLVILGSIGESPLVTDAERDLVVETTVRAARGRVPVVVGLTAHGTRVAVEQVSRLAGQGAAAALVALPQYYDLSFEAVRAHYQAVAKAGCPVLYYNYPAATRVSLSVEQLSELLCLPGMAGAKESLFDLVAIGEHITRTQAHDRAILTGSELDYLQVLALGGHGAISAGAVAMPRTVVALHDAWHRGDHEAAKKLQNQVFEALPTMAEVPGSVAAARLGLQSALKQGKVPPGSVDTPVARLKLALARRGLPIDPRVRAPLPALTPRDEAIVDAAMEKIRAIEP